MSEEAFLKHVPVLCINLALCFVSVHWWQLYNTFSKQYGQQALLSVYTVLGQGLSSGQCCLAPLTLLCLVTKQADGMALVRVKHCRPSLYIKFHVDCREVWFSSHYASVQVDSTCTFQGTGPKLSGTPHTRKMDVVRNLASHFPSFSISFCVM